MTNDRDIRSKRLDKTQARKLVTEIVNKHPTNIRFTRHALEELRNDNLIISDVLNVIKSSDAKVIDEPEFINGSYRYRLATNRIGVVIAFDSPISCVVVTAWRKNS